MRHVRPLLPYLFVATVIAAGSIALLLGTLDSAGAAVAPAASGSPRAAPQLSPTGRLAYWRFESSITRLWAASFDGSGARPIATFERTGGPLFAARWIPDGSAIGVILTVGAVSQTFGGGQVTLFRIDGTRVSIPLPPDVLADGFRIVDQRWSPRGTRVAVTLYRQRDGKTDVFIGSAATGTYTQLTKNADALARDWLDEDQVLVESTSGRISAMRSDGTARRLTDKLAGSPVIAEDGRVYFLAGQVTPVIFGEPPSIFVMEPTVWSMTSDGADQRLEYAVRIGGLARLDGRWPDGRFLFHYPGDGTQWMAGNQVTPISTVMVSRVVVSADRRGAIAFSRQRILTLDLTKATATPIPSEAFRVLLDGVFGADAWVRRTAP